MIRFHNAFHNQSSVVCFDAETKPLIENYLVLFPHILLFAVSTILHMIHIYKLNQYATLPEPMMTYCQSDPREDI